MSKKDFKPIAKPQVKINVQKEKADRKKIFIYLTLLMLLTIIVFSNSINNGLVPWDDNVHIYNNKDIESFDAAHLKKMFSTNNVYLYHPLTIISFALDYKLWGGNKDEKYKVWNGLNPTPMHFENLLLHLLNVLLVFYLLYLLTKRIELSALVALFFAIHPMHVESVSWATGRKDVLYSLFFLAALICYVKFRVQNLKLNTQNSKFKIQNSKLLVYCFVLFILALLSKPAAVTLPVLMILIDYYYGKITNFKSLVSSFVNKIPFFILSVFFALLPFIGQTTNTTVDLSKHFNYFDRFFLFNYAVFFYVIKLIIPFNLTTLHYYPVNSTGGLPPEYYLAPFLNILIILGVIMAGKYRKTLLFGFLFFFITICLSLQLVPYGQAIVAERYTYIPYIGLLFIVGKFYSDIQDNKLSYSKKIKPIFNTVLVIAVLVFSYSTYQRNKVWKDGIVLFTDVIDKSPDVFYGYNSRGEAKADIKDYEGALADYNKSIELQSNYADSYFFAGRMYYYLNNFQKSIELYNKAIEYNPKYAEAYCNRAATYFAMHNFNAVIRDCDKAIELKHDYADAYVNRGNAKGVMKDFNGSIEDFNKGISLNPTLGEAYLNRGVSKLSLGKRDEACQDFRTAYNLGKEDVAVLIEKNCK